jgi:hypothetical protein
VLLPHTALFTQHVNIRWATKWATGPKYWPPFAPWVWVGAETGWVWSSRFNLVTGPLGSVTGGPVWRRRWLLDPGIHPGSFAPSSLSVQVGRALPPGLGAHRPASVPLGCLYVLVKYQVLSGFRRKKSGPWEVGTGSCWIAQDHVTSCELAFPGTQQATGADR